MTVRMESRPYCRRKVGSGVIAQAPSGLRRRLHVAHGVETGYG